MLALELGCRCRVPLQDVYGSVRFGAGAAAGHRCKMFVAACALELGARASAACGCKMSFCSVGACMLVWVLLPLQEAAWALELGCWCRCRVGCRKMSTAACTFEPTCLCRCRVRSLVLVPLQVPWGFTQRQHWLFSTRQNDMDKHKNVEQIKHIFSSSISQGCGGSFKDRKP